MTHFFPNLVLAWTFLTVLIALLGVAAVIDLRRVIVPNRLAVTTLALGVFFNLARGAWLGSLNREVWQFGPDGVLVGAADGFLFALAGFATGFAIFFFMWILGGCGGGDVKLFAAVGAWVGPWLAVWIFVLSALVLFALIVLKLAMRLFFKVPQVQVSSPAGDTSAKPGASLSGRGLTYSLPLAVATALTLLWFFRFDLNLAQPRALQAPALLDTAAVAR